MCRKGEGGHGGTRQENCVYKPKKDFIMFKFVKDARRRSVETVLGAFGSTERTTDEEFDSREATFKRMMADMGDCKC